MKKYFLLLSLLSSIYGYSQLERIFASEGDAQKFVSNYTEPIFGALLSATNANWITSARPAKPFHFELNIGAAGAFIPESKQSFIFNNSDYEFLRLDSGPNELPTVVGKDSHSRLKIVIPINNLERKVLDFDAPSGLAQKLPQGVVPAPNIQLSMGLPLGFEVSARYLPKIEKNGGFIQITGFGLKHSISQYFKGKDDDGKKKKKTVVNLAIQANYQMISTGYDFSGNNKSIALDMNTVSARAIGSIDYKLLTIYGSTGYSKGYAKFNVNGTFDYTYDVQDNNGNHIRYETVSVDDPVKTETNSDEMFFNLGVKLKLAFFQIYADYTLQQYPVANVGIGFRF